MNVGKGHTPASFRFMYGENKWENAYEATVRVLCALQLLSIEATVNYFNRRMKECIASVDKTPLY